jgi:hypothetical protein
MNRRANFLPVISTWLLIWIGFVISLSAAEPFALRGYYLTFMRMPVMRLEEWKQAIDCFAEDDANVIILWTAGGFRSRKFPITWEYNKDHENIRQDFVPDLIAYAHTKKIRVILGFTPFGYDGVNRFPLEHPELKARQKNGQEVEEFGIHSRGWNLCPAEPKSQTLMREYIHEMLFDFYPQADGILIESSDYGICHCPDCGPRHYDHEFRFVRELSDEVWKRNTNAMILVYPHYFTGNKVPGLDAVAAKQPFDPRWGLFFTPHSAHFDAGLIRQAKTSIFSSDVPVLGNPQTVADSARSARRHGVAGFIPSLETFSYQAIGPDGGEPWLIGKRMRPFGLDPMGEGRMPYRMLALRLQRFAFREFSRDPDLPFDQFKRRLGENFYGAEATPQRLDDLFEFHRLWMHGGSWYWQSPLLDPEFFRAHARRLNWPETKLKEYDRNLERFKELSRRYAPSDHQVDKEMARWTTMIVQRWGNITPGRYSELPSP